LKPASIISGASSVRISRTRSCQRLGGSPADGNRKGVQGIGHSVFSPHDLRHRRIALLHRQGRSWAEIARFVGQRKLSITADTYTHVLVDGEEVDYAAFTHEGRLR
jgi:integrase